MPAVPPISTKEPLDNVVVLESCWIPLSASRRLHARIYLPADVQNKPAPAILHYHPYPLDWFTRGRDDKQLMPLAAAGIACVRVDMAGAGASDGLLHGEYLEAEIDDGVEVLHWIAAQPWCSGATGVMGTSWSGCNALQIAARRPPSLKAIISCDSTDDHYRDDIHYMGGCVSGLEMLNWGAWCHAFSVNAPDPVHVGDAWRDIWIDRLTNVEPALAKWLAHQRFDSFWKSTAVSENYAAIDCPVLMIGGWGDGYRSAVFRMLDALPRNVWAIVGPWCHGWPNSAQPGPNLDMKAIMVRWWRQWLCGQDQGLAEEPRLIGFLEESRRPRENLRHRAGHWLAFDRWSTDATPTLDLEGAQSSARGTEPSIAWHHAAGAGTALWCAYGQEADQAADQRSDDALALCLDWLLDQPLEILGPPRISLRLAASAPQALVAARLCDVAPDGSSTLITEGQLNLAHREGHEHSRPLPVDGLVDVAFALRAAGYRVAAGHRLRLALSPNSWPMAWPSPTPVSLRIVVDATKLTLPLATHGVAASPQSAPALEVIPASVAANARPGVLGHSDRTITHGFTDGSVTMRSHQHNKRFFAEDGLTASEDANTEWAAYPDDPLGTRTSVLVVTERRRADWHARLEVSGALHADARAFHLRIAVKATSHGETVHDADLDWIIARDAG